ncbi:hypothetical protein PGQ11_014909 [Apiospora arundinis]|uniref:Uncharacterized protein n=1 Tax=Apiospora arundinis TaxID=335852 RepID=A0ABR2HL06_9PEZI
MTRPLRHTATKAQRKAYKAAISLRLEEYNRGYGAWKAARVACRRNMTAFFAAFVNDDWPDARADFLDRVKQELEPYGYDY